MVKMLVSFYYVYLFVLRHEYDIEMDEGEKRMIMKIYKKMVNNLSLSNLVTISLFECWCQNLLIKNFSQVIEKGVCNVLKNIIQEEKDNVFGRNQQMKRFLKEESGFFYEDSLVEIPCLSPQEVIDCFLKADAVVDQIDREKVALRKTDYVASIFSSCIN